MNGVAMDCPTIEQLKLAILKAGLEVPAAEIARLERKPEWEQRWYEEDLENARNGWFRWRPTKLFQLASSGPGRRARNHAADALRQLLDENLVATFRFEGSNRVYTIRLTENGRAYAKKLDSRTAG